MRIKNNVPPPEGTENKATLARIVNELVENCNNCHPLTPLTCIANCRTWKQKNELRTLCKKLQAPNFMTNLLNTLKNRRRLQILNLIYKGKHSLPKLQKELKNAGYYHSMQTITKEYIHPLTEVGLIEENQNQYHITLFGCQLNEIIKQHNDFGTILPAHSECHEEIVLNILLNEPKTYEEFENAIQAKSVARVLNRLQKTKLVETTKENDYVFYFRTKRNPNKSKLSQTESRIYENILTEGISARKLCEKTRISLRRTYKYIRRLKGKKLVFARKKPKTYSLTDKGLQTALILQNIQNLTSEILMASTQIINKKEAPMLLTPKVLNNEKMAKQLVSPTAIQP